MLLPRMVTLCTVLVMTKSESSRPFPVMAISEVEIKDGSAHATNSYPAPWTPEKAFILGHANAWINSNNANERIFPNMVWYEFPADKTFVPARISFRPRQDCCLDQAPTVWQFVGSNDVSCGKFGQWTVLCEDKSNTMYPSKFSIKYCDVDEKILGEFKCLGISILSTQSIQHGYAALKDVRIWRKLVH